MNKQCPPWANGTQYVDWELRNCHDGCRFYDFDKPEKCPLNEVLLVAMADTREWTADDDKAVGYPGHENGFPYTWDCPSKEKHTHRERTPVPDIPGQMLIDEGVI